MKGKVSRRKGDPSIGLRRKDGSRWRSRDKLLLLFGITTIIMFIRKTDSIIHPQFWAEDGTVFFLQQYNQGVSALFEPYAGYLHVVPRLIALFSDSFFPYSAAPYVYNYSSLFLTLLVIANIFSSRLIMNNKFLLVLSVVLVPHYRNQVFLNITNLQWILAILIIVTLLKEQPHPKYGNVHVQRIVDFTVIICCGLTGPFIIFLLPFFVWKCFRARNYHSYSIVMAVIAVASIQLLFIINDVPLSSGAVAQNYEYARVVGQKLFGNLFLGISIPYEINAYFLCSLLLFLIVFIAYLSVDYDKNRSFVIVVLLGFFFAILLATLNKFKLNPGGIIPPGAGPRYFYLPYVMIVWSLIICLDQKKIWKSILVKLLLIVILISSLASEFHSNPFIDYDWQSYSKLIGKEQNLTIPINPKGWFINISPNKG